MAEEVNAGRLAAVPLFADLSAEALDELAEVARHFGAPTGTVLAEEGDFSSTFYILLEGHVTVHRGGRHLADLGKDDYFGEAGTMTCAPRNATVIATTPVQAAVLMGWELRRIVDGVPSVRAQLEAVSKERNADA